MGTYELGKYQCYYCGSSCDDSHKAQIKDTFNDRAAVACPKSEFRCAGCEYMMTNGVPMVGRDKLQKPWTYSWLVTKKTATPMTKSNIAELRSACLQPPEPPFAIVLAMSGQKHMMFRTPVNHKAGFVTLCMEGEQISYDPVVLRDRLALATMIAAACGKPSLSKPLSISSCIALSEYFEDFEPIISQWSSVWSDPVSRLAAFLCPPKEASRNEYRSEKLESGSSEKKQFEHGLF
jgi:CRISPR type IV-associated protein Csf1